MAVTVLDAQTELKQLGFYKGNLDGLSGPETAKAVVAFQESKGLPTTGKLDPKSLSTLFPGSAAGKPKTITATLQDWVLNYAQSKIVWVAGTLAVAVLTWINTRFGIAVPPDVEKMVTGGLVTALTLVIAVLRGQGKDTPRVSSVSPAVVQRPAEFVGQEKK